MIRFQLDTVIDEPIETVFDRLIDIDGYPDWMTRSGLFRQCGQTSEGAVETGTRFYDQTRFGKLRGEITELERPNRVAFNQVLRHNETPVFESKPSYILERNGEGTVVHHVAEGGFHGPLKLLEPIFYWVARRERRRVLDSLASSFG